MAHGLLTRAVLELVLVILLGRSGLLRPRLKQLHFRLPEEDGHPRLALLVFHEEALVTQFCQRFGKEFVF